MRQLITTASDNGERILHRRILTVNGVECLCGWEVWADNERSSAYAEHLELMNDLECPFETRLTATFWDCMRRSHMTFADFERETGWTKSKCMSFLTGNYDASLTELAFAAVTLKFRFQLSVLDSRTGKPSARSIDEIIDQLACDAYYCPTSGEDECAVHGGFDVCCAHPELHEYTDDIRPCFFPAGSS